MNPQKLSNLVQFLTAITLVAGIGLVVWELRQSREFVSVNLVDRNLTEILESRRTKLGENPLEAYARACESKELSTHDKLVLESFFFMQMALVVRDHATSHQFGDSSPAGAKIGSTSHLTEIFRLEEGHRFFDRFAERARNSGDPAVDKVLDIADELRGAVKPCIHSLEYMGTDEDP